MRIESVIRKTIIVFNGEEFLVSESKVFGKIYEKA